MASPSARLPTEQQLIDDLKTLRRRGLTKLVTLDLPALRQVVRAAGRVEDDQEVGAYAIEQMLREAVTGMGGDYGDATATLFGLAEGARADRPPELRKEAARIIGPGVEHFRHAHEPAMVGQLCQMMLSEAHTNQLRISRLRQDVRAPVGSRLAVAWLERFEAMYSVWSPVSGIGGDLTAYRATMLEEDRPWDREPAEDGSDNGQTQERQAAGYITSAFYYHTYTMWSIRRFQTQYGGQWLLPDLQAENELADAVERIRLHTPNNDRDDSYLRLKVAKVTDQEQHGFLRAVASDKIAMALHEEWQQWAQQCECKWNETDKADREMFPTHRNHTGIKAKCPLHQLVAAANDYCILVDDGWKQIADWYDPQSARNG